MNAISFISTARALANTFSAMWELGICDRAFFDAILRETLAKNPQYLGVWSVWEPNALDGRDREFANAPGHDQTGRFIPSWNRSGGTIHVEPNVGYDVPGFGDWYLVPAMLPVGATEQHGPHLPLNTDTVIASAAAVYASAVTGAPVLPTLNFTVSIGHTEKWPGPLRSFTRRS